MRRACFKSAAQAVERFFHNPADLRDPGGAAGEGGRKTTSVTAVEGIEIIPSAPKGAGDLGGLLVSLKRYPDTKLGLLAFCNDVGWNAGLIAALKGCATRNQGLVTGTGWVAVLLTLILAMGVPARVNAQGPAVTTVSGPVYRADGTAASGMALISWPSFQTAAGDTVTAGNQSVTIGSGGAFTAQLVPNAGASPAGTLYVVVFQLDDGTVRTEYWSVPTTSPATIAAVRTTPGTGLGNSVVTQQYVDAAVANRALDSTVVHLAGSETITGTKQFVAPPSLPQPVGSSDAANKGYVDAAVSNVGSGSYVSKAGDTMTGPLTLPGEPGRMRLAEDRITALEHSDIKRNVYDRIVTAAIAFTVSALIALHDHFLPK